MLQADDSQKIVFIFFYTAIIYHLAHIMKAKGMKMPRHITFSGNGSKVIAILTTDKILLQDFTKLIFEEIYGNSYSADGLSIVYNAKNPKEATCKGGIINPEASDYSQIEKTKVVLKSTDNKSFVTEEDIYKSICSDEYIKQTTSQVKAFIEFTLGLNKKFSFKNNFGLDSDSFNIAEKECFKDLETYTKNGLKQKMKEVTEDDVIEESLFFYPLNGMLNALSSAICESKLSQKI